MIKAANEIMFDEDDVMANIVTESFYEFVKEFWRVIIARKPVWNWHIKYLCNELQYIAELVIAGKPKEYDLAINISPGETKSTIASIMFNPWVWTRMPTAQFITTSYGFILATDLSRRSRDIIMSEKYQRAFPKIKLRHDQNVKTNYMNTLGGFRVAAGTGGVLGFHGHFITVDDPINPNEAISEAELKSTNIWMNETLSQRKVNKEMTPTILIMQRLHQDDPTANMIERAREAQREAVQSGEKDTKLKLKHICLPAELTSKVKPRRLRSRYKDGLMDVKRLPRTVLNESKALLGQYGYAGQMLQNPIPLGGGMFKTGRIVIDIPPVKWVDIVRYWDKAGTEGGGAFTVGLKMARGRKGDMPLYWLLDVKRGQWDSNEREKIIRQTAILDGKIVRIGVEQEPGSGGLESAQNTARNLAGFRVALDRPTGDKTLRADPFSVQVNNGNVGMVVAEWNYNLLNELQFFPFSKYKDQTDSASGAFNMLVKGRKKVGAFFTDND